VAIENTDPESENLSKVLTSLSIPVAEILWKGLRFTAMLHNLARKGDVCSIWRC
jgi:hypothetical protein